MGLYQKELPNAFPYVMMAEPNTVRSFVRLLVDSERTDVPNGSSFAITVDGVNGNWNLWLSKVSYDYLREIESNLNAWAPA